MKLRKPMLAALTGTSAMTAYSYGVSAFHGNNFREPELLAKMLHRKGLKKRNAQVAGWITHYGVGLLFTLAYSALWKRKNIPVLRSSVPLGLISGITGAAVWHATFKIHPAPPLLNYKKFYRQLIFAHLVFGIFSAAGYMLAEKTSKKNPEIPGGDPDLL